MKGTMMSWACAMAMGVLNPEESLVVTAVAVQRHAARHPGTATVDVSADGRFVAFESWARLSPLDTNTLPDVYVLDRRLDRLTLESLSMQGKRQTGRARIRASVVTAVTWCSTPAPPISSRAEAFLA